MTAKADTVRVSLDLDRKLYKQLVEWTIEATPKAGYRSRVPTAMAVRACVQLLMTWEALQDAVIEELLEP